MSHHDHKQHAPRVVRVALLTISDTRTTDDDEGGKLLRFLVERAGHVVVAQRIVRDEPDDVTAAIRLFADPEGARAQAILTTGGTGITRRDATYEAIASLIEKRIDGFGELFRALSFQRIGPSAMLSRALAGTFGRAVVFAMPGAPDAVRVAMDGLILPEIAHAVAMAEKE